MFVIFFISEINSELEKIEGKTKTEKYSALEIQDLVQGKIRKMRSYNKFWNILSNKFKISQ